PDLYDQADAAGADRKSDENPWHTVTRWLIVINVAFFVIDAGLAIAGYGRAMVRHDGEPIVQQLSNGRLGLIGQPVLTSFGYFSVDLAIVGKQLWRFFTYQFVHANVEHVLLNMVGLLLAGPLVESRMGRGRYLLFYLICGAAGPLAHIALSMMGLMQMSLFTPLVGASASIYGVLVAAARIAPDEVVMLAVPPVDVKLKNFVLVMIGLSLAAVLWRWQNAGGHAAHLGGAVAGYFLSRRFAAGRNALAAGT
ncbi:MAG TPA: rhomboid family intramembrane serine protease, partial [Tepidisphaeraceae bacterium]